MGSRECNIRKRDRQHGDSATSKREDEVDPQGGDHGMGMKWGGGVAVPARPNRGTGGQRGGGPKKEETTTTPKGGVRYPKKGTRGT